MKIKRRMNVSYECLTKDLAAVDLLLLLLRLWLPDTFSAYDVIYIVYIGGGLFDCCLEYAWGMLPTIDELLNPAIIIM